MTMKYADAVMFNDLKRFFKLLRRDLHNHVFKQRHGTFNPYPNGKNPGLIIYEEHLRDLFAEFRKFYFLKMVFVGPKAEKVTTTISRTDIDRKIIPYPKKTLVSWAQTDVGFEMFSNAIVDDPRLHAHLRRIAKCYEMAITCMDIYKRSGHEDFTIKCSPTYKVYMVKVFNRFRLNPRCVELDVKSKGLPVMVLNFMHKAGKS